MKQQDIDLVAWRIKVRGNLSGFFPVIFSIILSASIKEIFFLDYLEKVNENLQIKTVIIQSPYTESGVDEYLNFMHDGCPEQNLGFVVNAMGSDALHRYCNTIDQTIIKILQLNKLVIHICQGNIISVFMSLGLVCDYRIVTEDTVFHNVYQKVGMITKGTGIQMQYADS